MSKILHCEVQNLEWDEIQGLNSLTLLVWIYHSRLPISVNYYQASRCYQVEESTHFGTSAVIL